MLSAYMHSFLPILHEKSIEINENTLSFKIGTCLTTFLGHEMSAQCWLGFGNAEVCLLDAFCPLTVKSHVVCKRIL